MQIEGKRKNVKRRTSYLKRPCRTKSTCASSPFDSAKILRNSETAKQNLKNLAEKYEGINNVEGFLNDLWLALGIQNQGGNKRGGKPSRYALYQLQDGTMLTISIRASAHNANANKYIEHPPVPDINLSIVLQKKMRRNQFKDNPSVNIGEYVYVNQKIQGIESPLSQIANSLIGFLNNGEYVDTTGVAIVHGDLKTPQDIINNQQNINCNLNMNKKLIRLTESDLRKIVKESVGIIINEMDDDYPVWQDDNGNSYYGNYFHQTNNFEKVKTLWVLETKGEPGEVFLSPQEAAQYAASEMVDAHKEDGFNVEELSKEMMANFDELQGWSFGNYYCTQVELMRKKQ
jgi:hypothetical protein